jgi:hypothetical protein
MSGNILHEGSPRRNLPFELIPADVSQPKAQPESHPHDKKRPPLISVRVTALHPRASISSPMTDRGGWRVEAQPTAGNLAGGRGEGAEEPAAKRA